MDTEQKNTEDIASNKNEDKKSEEKKTNSVWNKLGSAVKKAVDCCLE